MTETLKMTDEEIQNVPLTFEVGPAIRRVVFRHYLKVILKFEKKEYDEIQNNKETFINFNSDTF